MTSGPGGASRDTTFVSLGGTALPALLRAAGAWLLAAGVVVTMVTPRLEVGGLHFSLGDVCGVLAGGCWFLLWATSRTDPACLRAGWPLLVFVGSAVSVLSSENIAASLMGLTELAALWLLLAVAVPNLLDTTSAREQFLLAASWGSGLAATANLLAVAHVGVQEGIPQVWGAAGGFQGYFQVLGLTVAVPRLLAAFSAGRFRAFVGWGAAIALNVSALIATQTRGAWLAAIVAMAVLAAVRRRVAVVILPLVAVAAWVVSTGDWAVVVRQRAISVFRPEVGVAGFESSVIRIGLAEAAWNMFRAHPLTGIGLKTFPTALPLYAPLGLPLNVAMGMDQTLTDIEGPHSTYLSLLAETGIVGALALIGWIVTAFVRTARVHQGSVRTECRADLASSSVLAGLAVVAVFNCFSEMNAAGTLPLVGLLALACGYGCGTVVPSSSRQ
jgi:O-antigen ligase